jgi:hypothetical protein
MIFHWRLSDSTMGKGRAVCFRVHELRIQTMDTNHTKPILVFHYAVFYLHKRCFHWSTIVVRQTIAIAGFV